MTEFTGKQALRNREDVSGISSALLRKIPTPQDDRPLGRRLLYLLAAASCSIGFVMMTLTRSWPDVWVFRLIYQAHDAIYLPLKGTLWTAWFPWSLAVWIPLAAIAAYAAASWVTGADPLRRVQQHIILRIATAGASSTKPETTRGADWLARIAAAGRPFGLGTAYLHSVVDHARAEELDHIEAAALAGESPAPDRLSRALALIDADLLVGLATRRKRLETQLLHTVFDLALLSHVERSRDGPVHHRIARVLAMLDRSGGFTRLRDAGKAAAPGHEDGADPLRALYEAQPPARHLGEIDHRLAALHDLVAASGPRKPAAELPESPELFADMVLGSMAFGLFSPPRPQWAVLATEALDAIETTWTGLVLSDRSTPHAHALARAIERSRLRTCRYLIQCRWASEVPAMAVPLWPDRSRLFWSLEGDMLAAGAG